MSVRPEAEAAGPAVLARQIRFTNKAFWRNPASAFFTFAFPLMFLVIFTALLGNGEVSLNGEVVSQSTYYVAAMAAFAVITACYTNIAISVTFQRDAGILKRSRGTPLPGWGIPFRAGRPRHARGAAARDHHRGLRVGLLRCVDPDGRHAGSVPGNADRGVRDASARSDSRSRRSSPTRTPRRPSSTRAILPLLFLSGVFIPLGDDAPTWIVWIGRIFPVKHFADGMQAGFLGTPFDWKDMLVVALWGIAGLLLAARFFTWEPRR